MESPFPTSLRRDPGDIRGLLERIDAQLLERIEEACDLFCLDLLVRRRRVRGQPAPVADNHTDRQEFNQLVEEFLVYLGDGFSSRLGAEEVKSFRAVEAGAVGTKPQRLLAAQAHLAKTLPDFWQRFDERSGEFSRQRLAEAPPKPSFLSRLFGS